jgi:hypothetical protein
MSSGFESDIRIGSGATQFTFSTWIKPDWQPVGTYLPTSFLEMRAPSVSSGCGADSEDRISFSYDSESNGNQLWVEVIWCQSDNYKAHVFSAVVDDGPNSAITGLNPGGSTSWNANSIPQFVNITFTIDGTGGFATTSGSASLAGKFYWNGQPLETLDTGIPTGTTTSYLTAYNNGSSIKLGGHYWANAHWQDQTLFYNGLISASDINTILYNSGLPNTDLAPAFTPGGVMFNYNEPYNNAWKDSTGIPPITLNANGVNINAPVRDDIIYVT